MLRDWGAEKKYHHDLKGFNYRMEGIQGAVLNVKLRHLNQWNEARRSIAQTYDLGLKNSSVRTPFAENDSRHVFHVYAIRTEKRESLIQHLDQQKIYTNIHYPIPVHLQKGYQDLGYKEGDLPITETLSRQVLSLPIFPEMVSQDMEEVVQGILGWEKETKS
jgi:dTDP-4-amino-4,6-dideoxygalactose transaminase